MAEVHDPLTVFADVASNVVGPTRIEHDGDAHLPSTSAPPAEGAAPASPRICTAPRRDVAKPHLILLHHGLWGNHKDLTYMETKLREAYPPSHGYEVVNFEPNGGSFTYDGVDVCGRRVVTWLQERLQGRNPPTDLSVIGYSLGGLILRYALGLLESLGVLEHVRLRVFTAFASPLAGAAKLGNSSMARLMNQYSSLLISRSGSHLMLADVVPGTKSRSLLELLADPALPFFRALARFERRITIANIVYDRTVDPCTSGLVKRHPYDNLAIVRERATQPVDPAYPHVIAWYGADKTVDVLHDDSSDNERPFVPVTYKMVPNIIRNPALRYAAFPVIMSTLLGVLAGMRITAEIRSMRHRHIKHHADTYHTEIVRIVTENNDVIEEQIEVPDAPGGLPLGPPAAAIATSDPPSRASAHHLAQQLAQGERPSSCSRRMPTIFHKKEEPCLPVLAGSPPRREMTTPPPLSDVDSVQKAEMTTAAILSDASAASSPSSSLASSSPSVPLSVAERRERMIDRLNMLSWTKVFAVILPSTPDGWVNAHASIVVRKTSLAIATGAEDVIQFWLDKIFLID